MQTVAPPLDAEQQAAVPSPPRPRRRRLGFGLVALPVAALVAAVLAALPTHGGVRVVASAASVDGGARRAYRDLGTSAAVVGTGAFSVEAVVTVRSSDPSGTDRFYTQSEGLASGDSSLGLFLDADGRLRFNGVDGAGHYFVLPSTTTLQPGQTTHVVATRGSDGRAVHLYLDGVDRSGEALRKGVVDLKSGRGVVAGGFNANGLFPAFDGTVSRLDVYDGELSANQAAAHFAPRP